MFFIQEGLKHILYELPEIKNHVLATEQREKGKYKEFCCILQILQFTFDMYSVKNI